MSCNEWKETEIGKIPKHWDFAPMKDYVEINMGQSPKSEFYNTTGEGLPFLQGNRTFGMKYPYYDTYSSNIKKVAREGDILFSVRAPVGDVNIATEEFCIGRGIASLRMKNGNQEYLYYLLREYRKYIENRESGTVFGSINKKGLEELKLPFPTKEEQKKIANILSSLDDKIQLNNEMNKTLEEMAQSLFKRWFVDFEFPNEDGEPYKSSGGEMVDSELGMIPKGWEVKSLGDIIDIHDSKRIPLSKNKREKMDKIYPYYGAASLMDYVDNYIFDGIYVLMGEDGTVIDENGYPILQYVWGKFWVNNHAHVLTGKNKISEEFIYVLLKKQNITASVTGAVQLKINQQNLKNIKIVLPKDEDLIYKYSEVIKYNFSKIRNNRDEIQRLSDLRDTLLPKLMSGEIKIN